MSDQKNGAQHLVDALKDAGVKTVFSLSGNQIMPVYDALLGSGIRLIHTRHEGAAVYMAEAHAQLTGEIGIALLTAGPGFANGLSAMYSARESQTPILVLTGDAPLKLAGRGAFQEMDQHTPAGSLAKASPRIHNPTEMFAQIRDAIALAHSGVPGPVHVSLHDDVLREVCTRDVSEPEQSWPSDLHPGILELINNAKRPLLLAAPSFARTSWEGKFAAASRETGIPMLALESPRGMRAPRIGALSSVLPDADVVILLSLTPNFLLGFGLAPTFSADTKFVCISTDTSAIHVAKEHLGAHRVLSAQMAGAHAVEALSKEQPFDLLQSNSAESDWLNRVTEAIAWRPADWRTIPSEAAPFHAASVAYEVHAFLEQNPQTSLVVDGGEVGQWAQSILDTNHSVINGPSGAIGGSIPYAIAAKSARPDQPAIAMLGDGTAGFYFMEFETALRENLPFVAIVGNDAKWNAEHQIQVRDYGEDRAFACEMTRLRYDEIAKSMGCYGEAVTDIKQLVPAIERALASGKPACLDVSIQSIAAPTIKRD